MFGGTWIYIGGRSTSVEKWRAHEGGGRAQGGRHAPYLVAFWLMSCRRVQVLWIMFIPKITFPKVSFRLDSV